MCMLFPTGANNETRPVFVNDDLVFSRYQPLLKMIHLFILWNSIDIQSEKIDLI